MLDDLYPALDLSPPSETDHALALRYAPLIRFDKREPFLPSVVGYTVFGESADSPSFPRRIIVSDSVACAIEYAVWWDWDIQHLYELEHIWVYLDRAGNVIDAEASWHGEYNRMRDDAGSLPLEAGRLSLHSEPGKHAFAPTPERLLQRKAKTFTSCGKRAGRMGLHVTPLFAGVIPRPTPLQNRLVHTFLERRRFQPTFEFLKPFDLRDAAFVPWKQLQTWIPGRVSALLRELQATIPPGERRVLRIAHRGASAYARENSGDALRAAAELGADMVEIDIRVTADDQPVVCHDSSLKRVYGVDGAVGDYTLDELRRLTAEVGEILSFDAALRVCKELDLGLYLDIKQLTPGAARSALLSLKERHYLRNAIFGSFRPDHLADIKAALPEARTSILFGAVNVDAVKLAQAVGADYVHPCWENRADEPHRLLTPEWIKRVRDAGLGIVCWHEERPAEIAALKALGVDAICSDQPELLL